MATEVDWILNQGRTLGVRARLHHKLDYLWRSCTGELSEQNDLFRLTYALELAKQYDWVYHVLSDSEWSGRRQIQPSASVNSICLLKSALDISFNDDGTQVMPVPAKIDCESVWLIASRLSLNVSRKHFSFALNPGRKTGLLRVGEVSIASRYSYP